MLQKIILITLVTLLFNQQLRAQKLPAYRTQKEVQLMLANRKVNTPNAFGKAGFDMPSKVRYPGEFEESQAICISWSEETDNQGNVITVDTTSDYAFVSAQLAKYISDELPVWIRIPKAIDSLKVLGMMNTLGWPLTQNYKFIVTSMDAWWMRDYGPNGIYWGDHDSLAFVDLKYYDGRDLDNVFPKTLASIMGIRNYESTLYAEGGNLMADGFGQVFFSDIMNIANEQQLGWDSLETMDTIANLFGATKNINLRALECDGGTGHIDLYTKLIDEQTLLVMQYPTVVTAIDKKIIEDNYQLMTTLKSTYNRPFRIVRFDMPTGNNGSYNRKSCSQINADARTYLNGITLNKTYLYPSYSDAIDGNKAQTKAATERYQKYMPGYKIIPIDARVVSPAGGSIHCITMQIPANNPVLFWHPSIDGFTNITTAYPIEAKITNHSGIASAKCLWRKRGSLYWDSIMLTPEANNMFKGNIIPGALTENDTLDYYLIATTNNGKTAVKPITAPDGFYTIQFKGYATGIADMEVKAKNYVYQSYPNPANNNITIPYQLITQSTVEIKVMDITGKEINRFVVPNQNEGLHQLDVNTDLYSNGLYFYSFTTNGIRVDTRKFVVKH
jgi:agmatine/peptidylarginine deiminase